MKSWTRKLILRNVNQAIKSATLMVSAQGMRYH
jgi:hypothetical protein